MANQEFPEYASKYSHHYRDLCASLPAPLRAVLIDIEYKLAENPDKPSTSIIPLDEHIFIYRHPKPVIEVFYSVEGERKIIYYKHLVAPTLDVRKPLFISYSHADEQWLLELKKWLKPLEQNDLVTIWDDQKIQAGDEWRNEIENALATAKAAVLLISMDFLNSEFIANNELPQLLNAASQRGLHIFWIAVRPSTVDDTAIGKYQAAHKEPPLALLTEAEREIHFHRIYKQIKEVLKE